MLCRNTLATLGLLLGASAAADETFIDASTLVSAETVEASELVVVDPQQAHPTKTNPVDAYVSRITHQLVSIQQWEPEEESAWAQAVIGDARYPFSMAKEGFQHRNFLQNRDTCNVFMTDYENYFDDRIGTQWAWQLVDNNSVENSLAPDMGTALANRWQQQLMGCQQAQGIRDYRQAAD